MPSNGAALSPCRVAGRIGRVLIDTHCHLTTPEIRANLTAVADRARAAGVGRVICVTTRMSDAAEAMDAFADQPWVSLCPGIHPHEAAKVTEADLDALRALHRGETTPAAWRSRIVAVGETGLDFHYDFAPADVQERVFRAQLDLAQEVGRPVVIHARKAEGRVADILEEYPALRGRVVFHCFSGPREIADRLVAAGHWLSFTGVVTFKNAEDVRYAARMCPADQLMVETDAPFLTPEPHRKNFPNEPAYVAVTARFIAELRGLDYAAFAELTTRNARRFFGLPEE
jgi:TatD DNase family protein